MLLFPLRHGDSVMLTALQVPRTGSWSARQALTLQDQGERTKKGTSEVCLCKIPLEIPNARSVSSFVLEQKQHKLTTLHRATWKHAFIHTSFMLPHLLLSAMKVITAQRSLSTEARSAGASTALRMCSRQPGPA